jgi:hypothetical protein
MVVATQIEVAAPSDGGRRPLDATHAGADAPAVPAVPLALRISDGAVLAGIWSILFAWLLTLGFIAYWLLS